MLHLSDARVCCAVLCCALLCCVLLRCAVLCCDAIRVTLFCNCKCLMACLAAGANKVLLLVFHVIIVNTGAPC